MCRTEGSLGSLPGEITQGKFESLLGWGYWNVELLGLGLECTYSQ